MYQCTGTCLDVACRGGAGCSNFAVPNGYARSATSVVTSSAVYNVNVDLHHAHAEHCMHAMMSHICRVLFPHLYSCEHASYALPCAPLSFLSMLL